MFNITNPIPNKTIWPPIDQPAHYGKRWIWNGLAWDLYKPSESSALSISNICVVAANGDDVTGQLNSLTSPFFTVNAAISAVNSNGIVIVYPGEYNNAITINKSVNIHFFDGVFINNTIGIESSNAKINITGGAAIKMIQNTVGSDNSIYIECLRLNTLYISTSVTNVIANIKENIELKNTGDRGIVLGTSYAGDFSLSCENIVVDPVTDISDNQGINLWSNSTSTKVNIIVRNNILVTENAHNVSVLTTAIFLRENFAGEARVTCNKLIDDRLSGANGVASEFTIYQRKGTLVFSGDVYAKNKTIYGSTWYSGDCTFVFYGNMYADNGSCIGTKRGGLVFYLYGNMYADGSGVVRNIATGNTYNFFGKIVNTSEDEEPTQKYGVYNNQAVATFKFENVIIDSPNECIFSTLAINVGIDKDFHYTVAPNSNVTLQTNFSKFPLPASPVIKTINNQNLLGAGNVSIDESKWEQKKEDVIVAYYNLTTFTFDNSGRLANGDWRVPNGSDFDDIFLRLPLISGNYRKGDALASKTTNLDKYSWTIAPSQSNRNEWNFNALPFDFVRTNSDPVNKVCYIWINQELFSSFDYRYLSLHQQSDGTIMAYKNFTGSTHNSGYSIRLVRNATSEELLLPNGTIIKSAYIGNDLKIYDGVKIGTLIWTNTSIAETKYNDGQFIRIAASYDPWPSNIADALDGIMAYSYYDVNQSSAKMILDQWTTKGDLKYSLTEAKEISTNGAENKFLNERGKFVGLGENATGLYYDNITIIGTGEIDDPKRVDRRISFYPTQQLTDFAIAADMLYKLVEINSATAVDITVGNMTVGSGVRFKLLGAGKPNFVIDELTQEINAYEIKDGRTDVLLERYGDVDDIERYGVV